MNKAPAIYVPPEGQLGPAMRNLPTDRMRAFVCAMLETGGRSHTECAALAGYSTVSNNSLKHDAHRIFHDERVQAAMTEEAGRRLKSGQILAVSKLLDIIQNGKDSDSLKAQEMLFNRTGMHATSEHKVSVTQVSQTDDEIRNRILHLAKNLGLDPQKLFKEHGIEEAEFTEVPPTSLALPTPSMTEVEPTMEGLEDL
jgi:phage terminase small subunit